MRECIEAGEVLPGDMGTAVLWMRIVGRRWPQPGWEVLRQVHRSPVTGSGERLEQVGVLRIGSPEVDAVVQEAYGGVPVQERGVADVPWESKDMDLAGMLPVAIRGFLPDPWLVGDNWDGDWRMWLWDVPRSEGWDDHPDWVGDPRLSERLFVVSQLGPWVLPLRADADRVMRQPPKVAYPGWLVQRGSDRTWWLCWVVDEEAVR